MLKSIDELREHIELCRKAKAPVSEVYLLEKLDAVELEHNEVAEKWFYEGVASAPDDVLAKLGLVRLPLDEDGEPICIGDVIVNTSDEMFEVRKLKLYTKDRWILIDKAGFAHMSPSLYHHKQPDTWERIEEDARKWMHEHGTPSGVMNFIARCKALAGESDGK